MRDFDKRAQNILLDAHWKSGWLDEQSRGAKADDISYAKSKGYWFDSTKISHDDMGRMLIKVREEATAKKSARPSLPVSPRDVSS